MRQAQIGGTVRRHRRAGQSEKTKMAATTKPVSAQRAPALSVLDDPRWARIVARDKTADGNLWHCVSTTGIYCRPSCPSRTANPKNVTLHDTLESAKATGFRPCKRCNPDGRSLESENAALVAKACRIIEESEEEPPLQELRKRSAAAPAISTACSRP